MISEAALVCAILFPSLLLLMLGVGWMFIHHSSTRSSTGRFRSSSFSSEAGASAAYSIKDRTPDPSSSSTFWSVPYSLNIPASSARSRSRSVVAATFDNQQQRRRKAVVLSRSKRKDVSKIVCCSPSLDSVHLRLGVDEIDRTSKAFLKHVHSFDDQHCRGGDLGRGKGRIRVEVDEESKIEWTPPKSGSGVAGTKGKTTMPPPERVVQELLARSAGATN